MRVIIGGQVVEDLDEYNRTHDMFHILTSQSVRSNDDVEWFGARYDIARFHGHTDLGYLNPNNYFGISNDVKNSICQTIGKFKSG